MAVGAFPKSYVPCKPPYDTDIFHAIPPLNPESRSIVVVLWFNGDERFQRKPYANFAGWIFKLLKRTSAGYSVQKTE
jgi:hypothetical protein